MKYKITSLNPRPFQPFTVEVTVENLAELKGLWVRFNIPVTDDGDATITKGARFEGDALWEDINRELLKYTGDQS